MMNVITITYDAASKCLCLEWESSPENDMWADAVVMVALEVEANPQAIKCEGQRIEEKKNDFNWNREFIYLFIFYSGIRADES